MKLSLARASIAIAMFLFGCSGSSSAPTRVVSGQLVAAQFHLVSAQVVAMSSSGRVFRAPVTATGSFQIALPTGMTYTLRFANATSAANLYDAFAVLAPSKLGTRTHFFTLTAGPTIDLGLIGRPGTVNVTAAPQSDGSDSGSSDSGMSSDDGEEDDGAEACDLSHGADMEDVESEHDLLDDTDSDHDGVADSNDSHDDRPACTSSTSDGDDCELTDDQEHEDEAHDDGACSSATGGAPSPGPTPAPGIIG